MKTNISILFAAIGLVFSPVIHAEESHTQGEHAHGKNEAGPNGGRVILSVEPHFEFFVTPEGKVKLTFLGEDRKAIAPAGQVVTAIGGDRAKPTKLTFTKEDGYMLSDKPLPDGNMIPIILQVKVSPDAKTVNEKFMVNLADCPGCVHKEYACTCDH